MEAQSPIVSETKPERVYVNPWYNKPENRELGKQRRREIYQRNRDDYLQARRQKVSCPCGGRYTPDHKSHHFKTKLHREAVAKAQEAVAKLHSLIHAS